MTPQTYTFIHHGFSNAHAPQLTLLPDGGREFTQLEPLGKQLTLAFDPAQRFCGGWHELATGQSFPCPDAAALPAAYDTCRHCQQKTGFNPAFYHATSVSPQQQARNAEPHALYIAHFGPGVMKVGISWAQRGIKRLLDQGARSGLIIKTYPTAEAARTHEAQAVKLPNFAETMQYRQKRRWLKVPYDPAAAATELCAARQLLAAALKFTPDESEPLWLDPRYLGERRLVSHRLIDIADATHISGACVGMIGSLYIAEQQDTPFVLPLHRFTGYRVTIADSLRPNAHAPAQLSLL